MIPTHCTSSADKLSSALAIAGRWYRKSVAITVLAIMLVQGGSAAAPSPFQYERLKSFGFLERSVGSYPSEVVQASDGKWYGTTDAGGASNAGTVFTLDQDGSRHTVLHTFSRGNGDGANEGTGGEWTAGLVEGGDGMLYGTTSSGGGTNDAGTVFRLNKNGTGYAVLHRFSGSGVDGLHPSGVTLGTDGMLYGTTREWGGAKGYGTVFKLNPNGSGYVRLHRFTQDEGSNPENAALLEGVDGALYGTCFSGGITTDTFTAGMGTLFKLQKDGSSFRVLHRFTGSEGDGRHPSGPLVKASDGALLGTTAGGGSHDKGTIFRLNSDGTRYTVLASFSEREGIEPWGRLVVGADGELYGTTLWGGANGQGTVFQLLRERIAVVHHFTNTINASPMPGLRAGQDGALYGTTLHGGKDAAGTMFKLNRDGSDYSVLHEFSDPRGGDAAHPSSTLLEGRDGALYGMTSEGATRGVMLFKIDKNGDGYSVLLSVSGLAVESTPPSGPLVEGENGVLYGTTTFGGEHGGGTIFRVNQDGSGYRVLHSFPGVPGFPGTIWSALPSGLVSGRDGVLYGRTIVGGTQQAGFVFKLNPDGSNYQVLHEFSSNNYGDTYAPKPALIQGADGVLYGTTISGGNPQGAGTVFKLNEDGSGYTILHTFPSSNGTGAGPTSVLLEGSDGSLYGRTSRDISGRSGGQIFRLNKDGSHYTVLHDWGADERPLESSVTAGLIEASDGRLYGTMMDTEYRGAVFSLNRDGTDYTVLHGFEVGYPTTDLLQGSDGALYGTTFGGGDLNLGTVFSLRPRPILLPPVVTAGSQTVRFRSMPGSIHELQRASALNGTWQTLVTTMVPVSGVVEFVDPTLPHTTAFYRTATFRGAVPTVDPFPAGMPPATPMNSTLTFPQGD
jgi:uncharacterized repeat protein (TIGR03803 family)